MSAVETMTLWEHAEEMMEVLGPLEVEWPGIQLVAYLNENPTPPSIDVYPADTFQVGSAFGRGQNQVFWIVRARVATAERKAGHQLLSRFMDPSDTLSVQIPLEEAGYAMAEVSGLKNYLGGDDGSLLGCEWRVTHYL